MKEIYEILAAWANLSRQCKLMESNLLSTRLTQPQADTSAMEAEFRSLKSKTQAAFKAASEAIRRTPRPGQPVAVRVDRQLDLR